MKVSVCTDMMYGDMPTQDAMRLLKAAGADAVEFWIADNKDLKAIAAASRELDLPVATFCAPFEPVPISPEGPEGYAEALKKMSDTCDILNCRDLIITSGRPAGGWTPNQMHDRLVATVEASLPVLEKCDMTLQLEPLNASELSYMRSSREAFDICKMFNSPRVKVLYDVYHMQYMEGNLINTIRENINFIGHFHIADLPNRTAPGTGEINFKNLAKAADDAGYKGYFGFEYATGADREEELKRSISIFHQK